MRTSVDPDKIPTAVEAVAREYAAFIVKYDVETPSNWAFDPRYESSVYIHEWQTSVQIGLEEKGRCFVYTGGPSSSWWTPSDYSMLRVHRSD